jgi:hypothetical protein
MWLASFILSLARYAITRLADHGCRVFAFKGEDMTQQTKPRVTPDPAQPIVTVDEIDEALLHTSLSRARDDNWHRWADALLDQRNRIARSGPARERRVIHASEYRDTHPND